MSIDSLVIAGVSILVGVSAIVLFPNRWLEIPPAFCSVNQIPKWIWYLSLFMSIALLLFWVNQKVLLSFMNSADEHSCYFLAECIKKLQFWARPPDPPEFFEVVHVGNKGGKWFSVYPPGWPLFLALGLSLHLADWMNPLLTALAVMILFAIVKKLYGLPAACLGVLLMATSPFFLLNGASYLSHPTCLLMIAVFLFSYVKWTKTKSAVWAFIGALSLGYGLGTRYLTMAGIAGPFLLYEWFKIVTQKISIKRKDYLVFAATLGMMIFLNLYYNYLITGNFLDAPNHYYHRWERLGFHSNHTFKEALIYVYRRLLFLMDWSAPALLVVYLAGLVSIQAQSAFDRLFRFGFFYVAVAYIFYYSWGGNQYGPRYYFEGFPFLAFFAGRTIAVWWKKGPEKLKKFLLGLVIASLIGNVYFSFKFGQFWYTASFERKALYQLAEGETKKPALVFIRGFLGDKLVMAEEDAVRNHPELNTPILYAHDLKDKNSELISWYPDRSAYLGYYDRKAREARLEKLYT